MKIKFNQIYQYMLFLAAIFVVGLCMYYGLGDFLWLLPLSYLIFHSICIYQKSYSNKLAVVVIHTIGAVRYVFIPFLYYVLNDYYILENGRTLLQYVPNKLTNSLLVVIFMLVEMTMVYLVIRVFAPRMYRCDLPNREIKMESIGISIGPILMLGCLLIISSPYYIGLVRKILGVVRENNSGVLAVVYNIFVVTATLLLIKFVAHSRLFPSKICRCCTMLLIWGIFTLETAIGATNGLSRWAIIFNGLAGYKIITSLYPEYKNKLLGLFGGLGIIGLVGTTVSKFAYITNEGSFAQSLQKVINYKVFNVYFGGPTNIEFALKTKKQFGHEIDVITWINDIFGNCPKVNHWLNIGENSIPQYFNKVIYGDIGVKDQVCPLIGQGYIYLGYLGIFLFSCLAVVGAMYFDAKSDKTTQIYLKYIRQYFSIVLSIFMCINLNIIFQFIWIKIVPFTIIYLLNYRYETERVVFRMPTLKEGCHSHVVSRR